MVSNRLRLKDSWDNIVKENKARPAKRRFFFFFNFLLSHLSKGIMRKNKEEKDGASAWRSVGFSRISFCLWLFFFLCLVVWEKEKETNRETHVDRLRELTSPEMGGGLGLHY